MTPPNQTPVLNLGQLDRPALYMGLRTSSGVELVRVKSIPRVGGVVIRYPRSLRYLEEI